jgi:hypothetical protein
MSIYDDLKTNTSKLSNYKGPMMNNDLIFLPVLVHFEHNFFLSRVTSFVID